MKKRITARANDSDIDAIMHNAPIEDLRFIDRCTEITEQIFRMLDARHWKQKDLAAKMSKSEAEISKLLSGTHNLTLRTIAHIETILDENIILTKAGIELKEENTVLCISPVFNRRKDSQISISDNYKGVETVYSDYWKESLAA